MTEDEKQKMKDYQKEYQKKYREAKRLKKKQKKQHDDYSIKVCSDDDYKSSLDHSTIMINNYFLM